MIRSVACLMLTLLGSTSFAQERPPFEQYAVNSLFNKEVQKELELVEEQRTDIAKQLQRLTRLRDELSKQLGDMKAEGASEQELTGCRDDMRKELDQEKEKVQKRVFEILLPHQARRLREISAQYFNREAMKQNRSQTGLLTPTMMEYLEIDGEQAKKIKQRSDEIRKQLMEKIQKLNEAAIKELMQELSPKQREKYQKLMGQRFVK